MKKDNVWALGFKQWLPLAAGIFILTGLVYAAVQQNYRQNANDPQIQVAEDVSSALTSGSAAPDSIVPANPTADMSQSLSTFLIIYTATGTPIGSSVQLDGKIPTPPSGVFDTAKKDGQNRFTWEPKSGVRAATVVMPYGGTTPGFVLVGRSLREVEKRESDLLKLSVLGGLVGLIVTFLLTVYAVSSPGTGEELVEDSDKEKTNESKKE